MMNHDYGVEAELQRAAHADHNSQTSIAGRSFVVQSGATKMIDNKPDDRLVLHDTYVLDNQNSSVPMLPLEEEHYDRISPIYVRWLRELLSKVIPKIVLNTSRTASP
jgi:hypothetical protein